MSFGTVGILSISSTLQTRIMRQAARGAFLALLFLFHAAGAAWADCAVSPVGVSSGNDAAEVAAFYRHWDGACAWSDRAAAELYDVLLQSDLHGVAPESFGTREIAGQLKAGRGTDLAGRDLLLTRSALRYAWAMQAGRVDLAASGYDIAIPRWEPPVAAGLAAALKQARLSDWLHALPPATPEYLRLKQALAFHRDLAARGNWPPLALEEGRRSLKPGETSEAMAALRGRLVALGDLRARIGDDRLDPQTVEAVIRFQSRHGLERDGVIGPKTLAALNVTPEERARQIALNMERIRIMAHAMPPTRVEVNAAAATAVLFEDGEPVLRMRTVVGTRKTPTPILSGLINTIIVNPPWVVPRSIYVGEIAPAIARDPDYLGKHDMFWQEGQLVQRPGPRNSLGRLKFEFASPFAVYLHDTNAPSLFASDNRFRSHGCIRLEKPLDLAVRLLEPEWPRERIEAAIAAGETARLPMSRSMPVVVAYWTAFVEEDGTVEFRDDIYGRDAALAALLRDDAPAPSRTGTGAACGA
ncbi:murein L,D-transpeptidase [Parvibaculum sp.]|uniref:L,D-transpeptidase family protein n=1 Tax=Parvibaculum sp. TaxID=2024848 RepID=UPI0038B31DC7